MNKKHIFNIIAMVLSLISLCLASFSLKLSHDTNKRQSEFHVSTITSVLLASHNDENNTLQLKTSEPGKILQGGAIVFPETFSIDHILFKPPKNEINLYSIEREVYKVLKEEAYLVYKKSPLFFKDNIVVTDFPIPVFVDHQSTIGGDSVFNRSMYYLTFSCTFDEEFVLKGSITQKLLEGGLGCRYQSFTHQGRVVLGGFSLFHPPWESEEKLSSKIIEERKRQIMGGLALEWQKVRLSNRLLSQKPNKFLNLDGR